MATGDRHTIPIGVGYTGWDNGMRVTSLDVVECGNEIGSWLQLDAASRGLKTYPGNDPVRLRSLTLEDAEKLCYLLFDLTQPLRDARDGKPPVQGGENEAGNDQSG